MMNIICLLSQWEVVCIVRLSSKNQDENTVEFSVRSLQNESMKALAWLNTFLICLMFLCSSLPAFWLSFVLGEYFQCHILIFKIFFTYFPCICSRAYCISLVGGIFLKPLLGLTFSYLKTVLVLTQHVCEAQKHKSFRLTEVQSVCGVHPDFD